MSISDQILRVAMPEILRKFHETGCPITVTRKKALRSHRKSDAANTQRYMLEVSHQGDVMDLHVRIDTKGNNLPPVVDARLTEKRSNNLYFSNCLAVEIFTLHKFKAA